MKKYVIGIDPGSTKGHGVAVYQDGKLESLLMSELMPLYKLLLNLKGMGSVIVHIEDVYGAKGAYRILPKDTKAVAASKGRSIGRCDWSQVEVERVCKHIGIEVVKHPISKFWKKDNGKAQFEKVTGWKDRSNEDTRSAAYFGWLGVQSAG